MKEHAVLVPTSVGPVGAIVSEPETPPLAQLVLLHGAGDTRAGVNAHWAQTARALCGLGLQVLRADYPGEGESHMAEGRALEEQLPPVGELVTWFRERGEAPDLLLLGSCYGARLAILLAAPRSDVIGLGLVVPALEPRKQRIRWVDEAVGIAPHERVLGVRIDLRAAMTLRSLLARIPVWMLTGERDGDEPFLARKELGLVGRQLEIEVVEGMRLHGFRSPPAQYAALDRIVGWASRVLASGAVAARTQATASS